MPSVTKRPKDLESQGPVLEVQFLISSDLEKKYREEGKEIPPPVIVNALIDTGATSCVIKKEIPGKLGLQPVGEAQVTTPSDESVKCLTYFMRMIIPSHDLAYEGTFIAEPLEGQPISCLIGRDVLKESILIYIGSENQFTLSIL